MSKSGYDSNKGNYKLTLDVRIIGLILMLLLTVKVTQSELIKAQKEAHRLKVRARANAQVMAHKLDKQRMRALKLESKPKWILELVKRRINNLIGH